MAATWLARPPVRRVEVVGESMRPTLEPGDRLLLRRPGRRRGALVPGDLVAVVDPRQSQPSGHAGRSPRSGHAGRGARVAVKRVHSTGPAGVDVRGDNAAASTDSRSWGPVPVASVRGQVVYRYHPPARRGPLGR